MKDRKFYLGLDIGTDSVGYAVTDAEYNILKFRGEPAWGVHLFEEASLAADRRAYRTARRRLDRRQQRVALVRELFAEQVAAVDPDFFKRQRESTLYRTQETGPFTLFNDKGYSDRDYHKQYPTIHHLLYDLMTSDNPHDVRLVCLACEWLVAHRGHFLSEIDKGNIANISNFDSVYATLRNYFVDNGFAIPWNESNAEAIGDALKQKTSVSRKYKNLASVCFAGGKVPKGELNEFPFNCELILKLLCGGTAKPKDLFFKDEYAELPSFTLGDDDAKLSEILSAIGTDAQLIETLKTVYDWSLLVDILQGSTSVSQAKVKVYETHKKDLALLKYLVSKYARASYSAFFRGSAADAYTAYSYHGDVSGVKKAKPEDFGKAVNKLFKGITVDDIDAEAFNDMTERIGLGTFMPKQRNTDNRVIPYQLYEYELDLILEKAEKYLPFLSQMDEDGLSVSDKIKSVFTFRVPYFVGPLNSKSQNAWLVRKEGRITPWNFESMVDLDKSEEGFIKKLVGACTYLPGETVLPADSILYHRFMVLNEINNLKVNGAPISVESKQYIYNNVFMNNKPSVRRIVDCLLEGRFMSKGDTVSGIDQSVKSNLKPLRDFRSLMERKILTEAQAEQIIERSTYSEDKTRFVKWLDKNFGFVSDSDRKYIARLKYSDFGRLSRRLLTDVVSDINGTPMNIITAMWETNLNLMELLSSKYGFMEQIEAERKAYYSQKNLSESEQLDEMYISNAVKRPILRTLDIVDEVVKAFGAPEKIFIEMARGGNQEQKGVRSTSRRDQILNLYQSVKNADVRMLTEQLEAMGDEADSRLQSDKLFLYYMQLGKCLYTGKPIDLESLMHSDTGVYNIEHIYPQSLVKDDSVINNKILVYSTANGAKSDTYPVDADIREKMGGYWAMLRANNLISDEKYRRLTRSTGFSADEKWGFINRQLTETTQSTKAVAQLLKKRLPDTEIVYVKARLASEFRQEFGCIKSRLYNDLHHAKDAYLNIVTGNVYNSRFTNRWFSIDSKYSLNTDVIYTRPLVIDGVTVWQGAADKDKVVANLRRNNIHMTRYAFCRHGGFFDQMPVKAAEGLVPLKDGMDTSIYGGYNKPAVSFFMIVSYRIGKKSDVMVMPVELLYASKVLESKESAEKYAVERLGRILGKNVDGVSFPMGIKPVKVNTVLSFDGYRMFITGTGNGGQRLMLSTFIPFTADAVVERYIKYLERLVEKTKEGKHVYHPKFDHVTKEENLELYDLFMRKYIGSIYSKRPNNPLEIMKKGREKFEKLDVVKQAQALLVILGTFGRMSGGCDMSAIGGASAACATYCNSAISNWKKTASDVRIVDSSASGLWEKTSDNLLDLK